MDERIVPVLAEGFERELYASSLQNLNDLDNKLRLNNFAYGMRELMRHVLNRLAPDHSVKKCVWYTNEIDNRQGITRRQRARFAVQGGLSDAYVRDVLRLETENIYQILIKKIDVLSKLTHVEEKVFGLSESDVAVKVLETEDAFAELFSTIDLCREEVICALWMEIDQAVACEAISETIAAIDEISAHYSLEDIYVNEVEIVDVGHDKITFKATGSISAGLQWGSNSDVRRGDGLAEEESFPFTGLLCSPVDDPADIQMEDGGLHVDTSSWTDVYYGQDERI